MARLLKEHGITASADEDADATGRGVAMPRVVMHEPRSGFHHPVRPDDIRKVLEHAGPTARYGLRLVELARQPDGGGSALAFGALVGPGHVRLFEQQAEAVVTGALPPADRGWLTEGGAQVEVLGGGVQTRVVWPGDSLRRFVMLWVLPHELGHHVVQHNRGKRPVRVLRTREHELTAELFAVRFREDWFEEEA